jgi:hypothetical protein
MRSEVRPISGDDPVELLERGHVALVADGVFESAPGEQRLFTADVLAAGKNVSFDASTGKVGGTSLDAADVEVLRGMLARFSDAAQELVRRHCPSYRDRLIRARTSFRPVEIAGRPSSWRKDDTRLHIDSFPATPVHGARILRVFSNVNPHGRPRTWRIGEEFEHVGRRFAAKLRSPWPGWSSVLSAVRVTKSRRSPYDWLMLQLHDRMKEDAAYQESAPQATVDFPAGATWMAFTDQVSHAAMAGQYQLEQTFLLPVDAMRDPGRSPLRILERIKGRPLA